MRPPLRLTSRLTVQVGRPNRRPMAANDSPQNTPREISSRSRSDRCIPDMATTSGSSRKSLIRWRCCIHHLSPRFGLSGMIEHMFEQLREAIAELSVPVDGRALTQLLGLIDQLAAKAAVVIGEFDRAALWELDGATSMRAWLRDAGLGSSEATRLTSTARRVSSLPVVALAWQRGELSGGQVQAIVHNVPDRLATRFAEDETELVPKLVGLSVPETATAMTYWAAHADDDVEAPVPDSAFHLSQTLDGVWVADGTFDPESGAIITKAIELAQSDDYNVPLAQRRAEALASVAAYYLDNQDKHLGGRHRPHVNVIVDVENLRGELVDQQLPLDRVTTDRLLCDCVVHRVLVDRKHGRGATIVEIAAATRSIPAALWSALVIRDRHCRFPGCDRPPTWTEGHHVQWVSQHGQTKLDNLVLLCRKHHRFLHQRHPGVMAKLEPDGTFHVIDETGRERVTHPPPPPARR